MLHASAPVVFVLDNDVTTHESLELLIRCAGCRPVTFRSVPEFLSHPRPGVPSCLIANVSLLDLHGFELQERIAAERAHMPTIFVADRCDVAMAVRGMKAGAIELLTKPFTDDALLHALLQGIKRSEAALERECEMRTLRADYWSLTPREREVMMLVVSGMLNKQVGGELGISEITVKAHRGNVMRKMKAASLAHLVNIALRLRISPSLVPGAVGEAMLSHTKVSPRLSSNGTAAPSLA